MENEYSWLKRIDRVSPCLVPRPFALMPLRQPGVECVLAIEAIDGLSLEILLEDRNANHAELLEKYGQLVARFHDLPFASDSLVFDGQTWPDWKSYVVGALNGYLDDIRRLGGSLPPGIERRMRIVIQSSLSAPDLPKMQVVHGDPSPNNAFVESSGSLRFLDLELTQCGDPMLDFASLGVFEFGNKPGDWPSFLRGYGRSMTEGERRRIALCRLLRIVRFMRGQLWMYRDLAGFEERVTDLETVVIHLEDKRCPDPRPLWLP